MAPEKHEHCSSRLNERQATEVERKGKVYARSVVMVRSSVADMKEKQVKRISASRKPRCFGRAKTMYDWSIWKRRKEECAHSDDVQREGRDDEEEEKG